MGTGIINETEVWSIDMLQGYGNCRGDRGVEYRHVAGVCELWRRQGCGVSTCCRGMGIVEETGVWSIDMLQGYGNSTCDMGMGYRRMGNVHMART
jgi:predicted GNAT superfamily acetyltransferase